MLASSKVRQSQLYGLTPPGRAIVVAPAFWPHHRSTLSAFKIFCLQLHGRQETIHIQPQCLIHLTELPVGGLSCEPSVTNASPDDYPVLLFHETLIRLDGRTTSCESNALVFTIGQ